MFILFHILDFKSTFLFFMETSNDKTDFALLVSFLIFISVAKLFTRHLLVPGYLSLRSENTLSESVIGRLKIAAYKYFFYISSFLLGMYALKDEKWVYPPNLQEPLETVPLKFKIFYFYEISFYINELLTIFFEPKKKDFYQMVLHHFVTLLLMYLSLTVKYMKFGLLILVLHDISDPILELSKILHYLNYEAIANISFFLFTTVFIVTRLFLFPKYIVYQALIYLRKNGSRIVKFSIGTSLLLLQLMHLIWTGYILALFIRIMNGKKIKDVREIKKEE